MALFTVDHNNVFGKSVQEEGTYNVIVARADAQKSMHGNETISADYEVLDGKYQGAQIRYQNLTWDDSDDHKHNLSVTRFNTLAVALGATDGTAIESVEQMAKAMLGKKLNINAVWDKPNVKGKIYLTVRGFSPLDPEGSKPNGNNRPQEISAGTSASGSTAPTGSKAPINVSDDDLPF